MADLTPEENKITDIPVEVVEGIATSATAVTEKYDENQIQVLEGLMLELQQLHIVDRNEINAILRLSDYGRLGGYVFKIISSTRWSTVLAKGKYVIAALRKEKTGNG